MEDFPIYDDDGVEELGFMNEWRGEEPQEIDNVGDGNNPHVVLIPDMNLLTLRLTEDEFIEILSSIYVGAEFAYPEKYLQILFNFLNGVQSPALLGAECLNYPTYAPFILYPLQNPYTQPDLIPDGYLIPPMVQVNEENHAEYSDYELNDIVVVFNSFPLDTGWLDDIHEDLPSVLIKLEGEGTVEIKLLNVPLGGMAIVTLDNPPNLVDILAGIITGADNIIELNLDTLSVPPETAQERIFELEVVGSGLHTVYIVFFPIIDDSLIPVRFGGGFRGVEVCGFEEIVDMGITDIMFDPTFRLKKLVLGEWEDIEGGETFDTAIQAIQLNAMKGYAGVQQILTLSIDPSYPEATWLGSAHEAQHTYIGEQAALALAIAESLRDVTDAILPPDFESHGFIGSALKDYIDAGGTPIDVEALEDAIAIAAAAAAAAQSTADDAITAAATAQSGVDANVVALDALDARLDALEASQMWNVHFDFLAGQHGWSGVPDWTSGVGFEIIGNVSISRADSALPDGRLMYMRLEMSNDDSVVRTYTVKIEGYSHESSYGRTGAGDFVHYHKIENEDTPNDLGLEFNASSPWTLKAVTFYGVGTPTIAAP